MKTEQLVKEAVVGNMVSISFVDAILLKEKTAVLKPWLSNDDPDGKKRSMYARMSNEQLNAVMSLCVFIDKITKGLDIDFTKGKEELFDGEWTLEV